MIKGKMKNYGMQFCDSDDSRIYLYLCILKYKSIYNEIIWIKAICTIIFEDYDFGICVV
ncbi:hypothetical protein [Clostridium pasteurianum]|uniref:hypothetical protein n=1 Tax=Clostridium pasteurianum TaxID=1501 RepID=UPI001586E979|nr:hypothetical protein [Clostridium pasteurianum]